MQTLSFKYKEKPKFKRTLAFKYNNKENTELWFSYKRIQEKLDSAVFNKPVAAIKVAAGFITMQELWASKCHDMNKEKEDTFLERHDPDIFLDDEILAKQDTKILNQYEVINGEKDINTLNSFRNHNASTSTKSININNNINTSYHYKEASILNSYLAYYDKKGMSIYENYYAKKEENISNIFKNINVSYKHKEIDGIENILVSAKEKIIDNIENILVTPAIKEGLINKDALLEPRYIKNTNVFKYLPVYRKNRYAWILKNTWAQKRVKVGTTQKDILLKRDISNNTNIYKHAMSYKPFSDTVFYKNIFANKKIVLTNIYKHIFANTDSNKNVYINKNIFGEKNELIADTYKSVFGFKDNLNIDVNNYLFGLKDKLYVSTSKDYFAFQDVKDADINKYHFFNIDNKDVYSNNYLFTKIIEKESFYIYRNVFANKDIYKAFVTNSESLYKNIHELWTTEGISMYKNQGSIFYDRKIVNATQKYREAFTTYETLMLYKNLYSVFKEDNYTEIYKNKLSLAYYNGNEPDIFVFKNKRGLMSTNYNDLFVKIMSDKGSRNIHIFGDLFLAIEPTDITVFKNICGATKQLLEVDVSHISDFFTKNFKDIYSLGQYNAISVQLNHKDLMLNRINLFCEKYSKNINVLGFEQFTKIKNSFDLLSQDLLCDKEAHKLYIQYRNFWAIKEKFNLAENYTLFASKTSKNLNILKNASVFKEKRGLSMFSTDVFTFKTKKQISIYDFIGLKKEGHSIYLFDQYFLGRTPKNMFIRRDLFAGITSEELARYESIFTNKENKSMSLLDLTSVFRESKEMDVLDTFIVYDKTVSSMEIYKQIEQIKVLARESRIADHIGEWVWTYEPPDPFNTNAFGIDELLLPEVDTRYEDFEELIFNKKTQRPRNPIKVIDSNTWIAKLPARHPLPERKNIGNVYTGVIRENYFGVRTSIMHQVYLEFYTLWQSHIFEFAAMSMIQSLKKMLDYLYSYILENYNDTQLPEALRVYHQIRWFGECAVLNNSRYIISIERDNLKSNLHTGGCDIPNNLNSQDTMYVDSTPGICAIRNNEAYVGSTNAYVEFYLKTHANTIIRFDLINTIGSVNIYIDDILVDTISTSKIGAAYPLDYTGDTITVRIEKTKESNLNNRFFICNIIVENESYKDLSIDFDPTLKAGNAPMDEIARKMIEYANQHDDMIRAYNNIKKANLGVSVTFDQMIRYWEQHHQDKIKGKRLTIKKT